MPSTIIDRTLAKYITHPKNGFHPATPGEQIVFGARRPGFPSTRVPPETVNHWLAFMIEQTIQQVVCCPQNSLPTIPAIFSIAIERILETTTFAGRRSMIFS